MLVYRVVGKRRGRLHITIQELRRLRLAADAMSERKRCETAKCEVRPTQAGRRGIPADTDLLLLQPDTVGSGFLASVGAYEKAIVLSALVAREWRNPASMGRNEKGQAEWGNAQQKRPGRRGAR